MAPTKPAARAILRFGVLRDVVLTAPPALLAAWAILTGRIFHQVHLADAEGSAALATVRSPGLDWPSQDPCCPNVIHVFMNYGIMA